MVSKPRKAKRPRLTVVGHIGTPEAAVDLLSAALHRAEEDETLAVAIIEVRREGVILRSWTQDDGQVHALMAGCGYLLREIGTEEE